LCVEKIFATCFHLRYTSRPTISNTVNVSRIGYRCTGPRPRILDLGTCIECLELSHNAKGSPFMDIAYICVFNPSGERCFSLALLLYQFRIIRVRRTNFSKVILAGIIISEWYPLGQRASSFARYLPMKRGCILFKGKWTHTNHDRSKY
jgi:hypothetical protein